MHLKVEDKNKDRAKGDDKQKVAITYSDNFMKFLEMETAKRWEFVKQCCTMEWATELINTEENDEPEET